MRKKTVFIRESRLCRFYEKKTQPMLVHPEDEIKQCQPENDIKRYESLSPPMSSITLLTVKETRVTYRVNSCDFDKLSCAPLLLLSYKPSRVLMEIIYYRVVLISSFSKKLVSNLDNRWFYFFAGQNDAVYDTNGLSTSTPLPDDDPTVKHYWNSDCIQMKSVMFAKRLPTETRTCEYCF